MFYSLTTVFIIVIVTTETTFNWWENGKHGNLNTLQCQLFTNTLYRL